MVVTTSRIAQEQQDHRCNPPACVRYIGHKGECRPNYGEGPRCGAWMPFAKEECARFAGHRDGCRTRYALDNNRDARWRGVGRPVHVFRQWSRA